MGFRFRRSVKIAPGIRLNLSKSGPSVSFGPRGAKFTVGPKGTRTTVGIPGTGLYYTQAQSYGGASHRSSPPPQPAPGESLNMGFFKRLTTPPEEQAFVDGLREIAAGNKDTALSYLRGAVHLADGAFMAGMLSLEKSSFADAEVYFKSAVVNGASLGTLLSKYGIAATMSLAITDECTALFPPCVKGALLALVEIYQIGKRYQEAAEALQRAYRIDPSDPVVRLSIAELFMETRAGDETACRKVLEISNGIENESPIHSALLLYRAKALSGLGMHTAAVEVLGKTLRKTKDRSVELLQALRYERALAYEAAGQKARARADLEKLYAEAPGYEDVARRLGLG